MTAGVTKRSKTAGHWSPLVARGPGGDQSSAPDVDA